MKPVLREEDFRSWLKAQSPRRRFRRLSATGTPLAVWMIEVLGIAFSVDWLDYGVKGWERRRWKRRALPAWARLYNGIVGRSFYHPGVPRHITAREALRELG